MMEGMNQTGQEEYIWAMRSNLYRESDSDLWKERRASPIDQSGGGSLSIGRRRGKSRSLFPMTDDHHTKVLASLVPDEIIYNVNDYTNRPYDACLLFGDVSGFTDLCEKYNKTGKGGPSRLTQVLNSYIGSMVQEVMSHGGDVLKFSGDAFLAMWKSSSEESMPDCIHEALDCALMIQKSYGTYETDVGVILKVKLAISAGHVIFSLIGNEKMSHYVVVGQPIWDVKAAEHKSSGGEIIVSPTAWNYINANEYLYEHISDGLHVKVHGLGPNWRNTQRSIKYQKNELIDERMEFDDESSSVSLLDLEEREPQNNEEFLLRPAVNDAAKLKLKEALRRFIIRPVMRGIDLDEPLEYLTEMRQVVIVFINVVVKKMELPEHIILVDTAYKIICSVADEMQGCVNKVSLFDKDLMFVLIFGLRGFKHVLESQIGLRCASECYSAISNITGVKTTSIAVTTGMSYCGVVGHTLRREYTVISLTVNKAARLMVAYPNKVTCDRETFLHSKMEAKNFILQEYKELKGITNAGPVYEFKEVNATSEQGMLQAMNPYPLLGRDDEVNLFLRLLNECIDVYKHRADLHGMFLHHNTLVIRGEARQGKTRLLDEFIYCTPPEVPIIRFSLSNRDWKIPYQTIQLIFSIPLGITDKCTTRDREEKLVNRLKLLKSPELFCILNNVFRVNFEKSPFYLSLNKEEKEIATRKMIKQLCYGCFTTLWVVLIDDAEYIDDESWSLFNEIINLDMILLIMAIGNKRKLPLIAQNTLKHNSVRFLTLKSIDKWYHAGLACQILDVHAIPPELEKVIQSRSNGNPGWVESFLVSLIQAGGLFIRHINKNDVNDLGLVSPPFNMMIRLTQEELKELQAFSISKDRMDEYNKRDYWEMYQYSYKDSYMNLVMQQKFQKRLCKDKEIVPVCTIAPNFNIGDVDPELTMDVMMLKTFDSLTSYEQLLLKCSAILGEVFSRDMLLYIMATTSLRTTALAIKKLFEIRVLGCARGDFTEGDTGIFFQERLNDPNRKRGIRCDCRGLKIHESCSDLPKYASCGYLRFRLPMFRETTYNLLTDNQKKEFHNRALRYLEKETRRCRACGNGFFVRILGARHDEVTKTGIQVRPSTSTLAANNSSIAPAREDPSIMFSPSMLVLNSPRHSKLYRRDTGRVSLSYSLENQGFAGLWKSRSPLFMPIGCFGFTAIRKLRHRNSLIKTFSAADFTNCQCPMILNTMYTQMLEHCKGAGRVDKLIDAMIEYSYVCIVSCNIPQAMKILDDALIMITSKKTLNEEQVWKIPLMKGKIYTLHGYSRLELGQVDEANNCFNQAMAFYGYPFPISNFSIKLKTFYKELRQQLGLFLFPNILIATVEGYEAEFCDNLSECLSLMCVLYMDLRMWKKAELAATWSLNEALQSEMDFYGLCFAYSNMMEVMHHLGKQQMCVALEVHALLLCQRKKSTIEAQELKAVAKLYGAIFLSRLCRSETDRAINIGFIMLRICSSIHAVHLILSVLPLLVASLLIKCRIIEAVSIIHELEFYADEDSDNSGKTWFYAMCVNLQLETGYTVIPFQFCKKYYQVEGDTMITVRDPDAERRFFVTMWLWCIRNEDWEAATVWYTKANDFTVIHEDDSLSNIITALYLLEGLILHLVGKMDKRNVRAVAHAYEEINNIIKSLERASKTMRVIEPRFYHLKAYFYFVKYNDSKAFKILNKARKLAIKYGNLLEMGWIEHSELAWNNNLPSIMAEVWREHCEPDNLMDYHEIDLNGGKLAHFTLPTPVYA